MVARAGSTKKALEQPQQEIIQCSLPRKWANKAVPLTHEILLNNEKKIEIIISIDLKNIGRETS